jgi:hypothetical protein
MKSDNVKFFPFSPGLPWAIKHGRYVVPQLPLSLLTHHLKKRDLVVAAFGGLLESYYSLSILETLNGILPKAKLFWNGNPKFHHLVDINGLAKPTDLVSENDLERFPTPVFFDKEDRAYFNCLNNYLAVYTYYLTPGYQDGRSAVKQIVEKSTFPVDRAVFPQIRHKEVPPQLDFHFKSENIQIEAPFVLIFPDKSDLSVHDVDCLGWEPREVNALAAMLSQVDIQLIAMTQRPGKYFGSLVKLIPLQLDYMLHLMPKSLAVLSKDVDFLFVANHMSDAILFSLPHNDAFKIEKNNDFLSAENVIYVKEEMSPHDVLSKIQYVKGQYEY